MQRSGRWNRESFEKLRWWMLALDALGAIADRTRPHAELAARLTEAGRLTRVLARAGEASKYQLDKLEDAAAES